MKHLLSRSVCLLCLLTLCLSAFALPASAEEKSSELVNLYTDAVKEGNTNGLLMADGSTKTSLQTFSSGPIAVSEGDVITFGPTTRGLPCVLQAYDANGQIVKGDVPASELTVPERSFTNQDIYSYTVPAGVATVRLALYAQTAHMFTVTKNQPFDAAGFDAYWRADPVRARYANKLGQIFKEKPNSPLRGQSALFVGDSICYAKDNDFYYNAGWEGRLQDINGMDSLNLAAPGASVSDFWADNRVVAQFDLTDRRDFDFVVMHGVANDAAQSVPVGTLSEGFDAALDESTFAGGLEALFREAKRRYPDATLGFIINYSMPAFSKGAYPDIDDYVDIMTAACEKWGIHALDLYHDEAFCHDVLKTHTKTYLFDTVHPTSVGYDLLYPKVEAFMEELFAIRYPEKDEPHAEIPNEEVPDTTSDTAEATSQESEEGCASSLPVLLCLPVAASAPLLLRKKKRKS